MTHELQRFNLHPKRNIILLVYSVASVSSEVISRLFDQHPNIYDYRTPPGSETVPSN
jgi:hypothetical protein